jgi:lysyl-tRNA synthetase class II
MVRYKMKFSFLHIFHVPKRLQVYVNVSQTTDEVRSSLKQQLKIKFLRHRKYSICITKRDQLMLHRDCGNDVKYINTLRGQKAQFWHENTRLRYSQLPNWLTSALYGGDGDHILVALATRKEPFEQNH